MWAWEGINQQVKEIKREKDNTEIFVVLWRLPRNIWIKGAWIQLNAWSSAMKNV